MNPNPPPEKIVPLAERSPGSAGLAGHAHLMPEHSSEPQNHCPIMVHITDARHMLTEYSRPDNTTLRDSFELQSVDICSSAMLYERLCVRGSGEWQQPCDQASSPDETDCSEWVSLPESTGSWESIYSNHFSPGGRDPSRMFLARYSSSSGAMGAPG